MFLEALVMEGDIGFLATRIKISYVETMLISLQIGLVSTFLLNESLRFVL